MSKVGKVARKAVTASVATNRTRISTYILSQMASAGPPLGSQLGEAGINIANFVKDFNLRTSIFKKGVPIPCNITVNADRSYNLVMSHPPYSYFLKQAAGITRGAMNKEIVGMITRKHVYEIAVIKSEDPRLQMVDLQDICQDIAKAAASMGIKIVDQLDPDEYDKFLAEAQLVVDEQLKELKAKREAKLLRQ